MTLAKRCLCTYDYTYTLGSREDDAAFNQSDNIFGSLRLQFSEHCIMLHIQITFYMCSTNLVDKRYLDLK
jgi:hypothetical protein